MGWEFIIIIIIIIDDDDDDVIVYAVYAGEKLKKTKFNKHDAIASI